MGARQLAACNSRLVFCHLNNRRVKGTSFLEFLAKPPTRPLIGPSSEPMGMSRALLGQACVLGSSYLELRGGFGLG